MELHLVFRPNKMEKPQVVILTTMPVLPMREEQLILQLNYLLQEQYHLLEMLVDLHLLMEVQIYL